MSIITYTGVMGSGKTYEAVSTAALTALKQGRRVVTNISGFNYEAIRDHLGPLDGGQLLSADRVVVVSSSRITEERFFYDPDLSGESVVVPGDLVLIDEVWEFWGEGCKLLPDHQKFFRMHRHYTEAGTGTSCDLVIMIQDLGSLHRFIRRVIQMNLLFTKLSTLGLTSAYRVEVYEGYRQTKRCLVSSSVKRYDKAIFPLYQSYDGGNGNERVVDGRQNLFRNPMFVVSCLIGLALAVYGGLWITKYQDKLKHPDLARKESAQPLQGQAGGTSAPIQAYAQAVQSRASDWRLVAVVTVPGGETKAFFQDGAGRMVRSVVHGGLIDGWDSAASIEGRMAVFGFIDEGRAKK